jgi:hypothetical protein
MNAFYFVDLYTAAMICPYLLHKTYFDTKLVGDGRRIDFSTFVMGIGLEEDRTDTSFTSVSSGDRSFSSTFVS